MKLSRIIAVPAIASTLALGGTGIASASTYVPPGSVNNNATTCDAGHGAFGWLNPATGYWVDEASDANKLPTGVLAPSAGSQFGMEQFGGVTGANNSSFSATCNS